MTRDEKTEEEPEATSEETASAQETPSEEETPADEAASEEETTSDEEAPSGEEDTSTDEETAEEEDTASQEDAAAEEEREAAEAPAPRPPRAPRERPGPGVVAGAVLLGLVGLNLSGVPVGLPSIQADVDASFRDLVWMQVAFLLGIAVFVPLVPVIAGALGRRPGIVLGCVVMAAGSGLALVSTTPETLIAGRALQGSGAALLLVLLPAPGAAFAVSLALGPVVGGALVKLLDWQWLFWIQFALLFAVLILGLRAGAKEPRPVSLDPLGTAAYALGLPAVVIALIQLDEWSWQVVLGVGVAGVLALASLVPLDRRTSSPVVDVRPFRDLTFLSTAIACAVLAGSFWAVLLFEAQSLQDVFDHTALETGLILLPLTLPLVVAGQLRGRFDDRTLMMGALIVGIGGLAVCGFLGKADNDVRLVPGLVLVGLSVLGAAAALPALAIAKLPVAETETTRRTTTAAARRTSASRATGKSTAERERPHHRGGGGGSPKPKRGAQQSRRGRVGAAEAAAAKKRREEREKAAKRQDKHAPAPEKDPERGRSRAKKKEAEETETAPAPGKDYAPAPSRAEGGALEWSRLAGGVIVLAAISSLFLWLFANRKAEVTPSASEGGPGPNTQIDGILAGSSDVAHRLAEFAAGVRLGVELAVRDALTYASGRALFLAAALLLAAVLFMWRTGPPPTSPDPDQDDPRHSRFPL